MADPQDCSSCRFSRPTQHRDAADDGFLFCRRMPPQIDFGAAPYEDGLMLGRWPAVSREDDCGEWQPLPDAGLREP